MASVLEQTTVENPFGIMPLGNSLLFGNNNRDKALGNFRALPDELLHEFISRLPVGLLVKLAQASTFFYCFCYDESIWREKCLAEFCGNFDFWINWKQTYSFTKSGLKNTVSIIKCCGVYSDFLYTSWRCASVDLEELCGIKRSNIDKRSNLSYNEFCKHYAQKNRPVIITDIVTNWPAYRNWNFETFQYSGRAFRCENVDLTYRRYLRYMKQCSEESPLYLFDKQSLADYDADYTVPDYFSLDLFSILGDKRPDYRWLIVGPKRSGSTFHKDPNSTSAWNAVIKGSKKWILFPPNKIPPGVYPTKDEGEVTAPVNLVEWYLNYYPMIHQDPDSFNPIEGVCNEGELIFVPRGWWHSVINLENTLAITQNFVSEENLIQVLKFLKDKPDQVSGYKGDLYKDFLERLKIEYPDIWCQVEQHPEFYASKKGRWADLTLDAPKGFEFKF